MLQSLFRMSLAMYTLYLYNNHVGKFSFILLVMLAMIFSSLPIAAAVLPCSCRAMSFIWAVLEVAKPRHMPRSPWHDCDDAV